jgi:CheY-like chemotaxis protein
VFETGNLNKPHALRLVVADTGSGISSDLQTKVFDPFFSTKFAGRGLGLAVVKSIVGTHNGSISLISSPDKGTAFEVQLPCDRETTQIDVKPSDSRKAERLPDSPRSVLVVEDETELRVAVGKLLRRKGFSVVEAGDGTAALECLRAAENTFDAMVLDLTLPGVPSRDVFEQAQRLRSGIKVILTSAHSRETVDSTLGLPVEHFVRKPFRIAGLIEVLEDILS